MTQRLVVIGGGDFGRAVLELVDDINSSLPAPPAHDVGGQRLGR